MKKLFKNKFKVKVCSKGNEYIIKYTNLFGFFWITLDKCHIDTEGSPYMDEWIFDSEADALNALGGFKTMKDVGRHWNNEITIFTEKEKNRENV